MEVLISYGVRPGAARNAESFSGALTLEYCFADTSLSGTTRFARTVKFNPRMRTGSRCEQRSSNSTEGQPNCKKLRVLPNDRTRLGRYRWDSSMSIDDRAPPFTHAYSELGQIIRGHVPRGTI